MGATESGEQAVRRWNMPSQELAYRYNYEQATMTFVATPHERSLLVVMHNVKRSPVQVEDRLSQTQFSQMHYSEFQQSNRVGTWSYEENLHRLWTRVECLAGCEIAFHSVVIG